MLVNTTSLTLTEPNVRDVMLDSTALHLMMPLFLAQKVNTVLREQKTLPLTCAQLELMDLSLVLDIFLNVLLAKKVTSVLLLVLLHSLLLKNALSIPTALRDLLPLSPVLLELYALLDQLILLSALLEPIMIYLARLMLLLIAYPALSTRLAPHVEWFRLSLNTVEMDSYVDLLEML